MKRLLSLILAFCFLLSLTACGAKDNNEDDDNIIDLEYYASVGKIPECAYSLGEDVEKVKAELSAAAEVDEEKTYYLQEGKKNVLIDSGAYNFYYIKEKAEKGISYIASYEAAYGFAIGAVDIEVKEALKGNEFKEEPLSEDNAFFLTGASNGSVLKCEFEKSTIIFVFVDNALSATAIYTNDDWK